MLFIMKGLKKEESGENLKGKRKSKMGPRRKVTCHPSEPHFSNGLCKSCYRINYYKLNRDTRLEQGRQWRARNKEKVRFWDLQWKKKNTKYRYAYNKDWLKRDRRKHLSEYRQYEKEYRMKNVERRTNYHLLRTFNINIEERNAIFAAQNNQCAICSHTPKTRNLNIDHDHSSGLIRGGLCYTCNRTLGLMRDDPERFLKAVLYLLSPPAIAALGAPRFGLPGRSRTKKQRDLAKRLQKNPKTQTFTAQDPKEWIKKYLDKKDES